MYGVLFFYVSNPSGFFFFFDKIFKLFEGDKSCIFYGNFMSVANDNHILFCFRNLYVISQNKIGILLHLT